MLPDFLSVPIVGQTSLVSDLLDWSPWASAVFAILALFGLSISVCERYAQNARDETIAERAARRVKR